MPDNKLGLLYFGRLDDEKWFGLILNVLQKFIKNYWDIPFSFYVFWKGKYVPQLLDIAEKYSSVHFFGWQSLDTIKRYKDNCHYCLMPSMFLETFWLTALNALSMWLPVIGFSKGWLSQFVLNKHDISSAKWKDDTAKLYNRINWLLKLYQDNKIDKDKEHKKSINISKKYTIDQWVKNFEEIAGKPKKILLVTDFKSKLWGIETYIHDIREILSQKWYEVKIYWNEIPQNKLSKLFIYFGLFKAIFNIYDAVRLKYLVKSFRPKIIRYHSTIRSLGRLPVKVLSKHSSKKFMMYHDLWYFHPFPSDVFQTEQIKTPFNIKNFVFAVKTNNIFKFFAIIFKFISVRLLKIQLKKSVDLHLVPSEFMEPIVSDSYKIKPKKVQTLSHFIQK